MKTVIKVKVKNVFGFHEDIWDFHCILYEENLWGFKFSPSQCLYIMQIPFGYTRKDVLLIGLGITALGVGLKYGLEVPHFLLFPKTSCTSMEYNGFGTCM